MDPDSWVAYFKMLGTVLAHPAEHRPERTQVELAWQYAYRFFFEYPRPFPWHLVRMWEDVSQRPISSVLSPEGCARYASTFAYLTGEKMDWTTIAPDGAGLDG